MNIQITIERKKDKKGQTASESPLKMMFKRSGNILSKKSKIINHILSCIISNRYKHQATFLSCKHYEVQYNIHVV